MRITSGAYRGRRLSAPGEKRANRGGALSVSGEKYVNRGGTHPMGDRERLALFNSLGDLTGKRVLDLFAGTGALGLEALSHGAEFATFVEKNSAALRAIKRNVKALGAEGKTEVIKGDVVRLAEILGDSAKVGLNSDFDKSVDKGVDRGAGSQQIFDAIFLDPPYDNFGLPGKLLDFLDKDGIVVISHPKEIEVAGKFPELELLSDRAYARANLAILRHK